MLLIYSCYNCLRASSSLARVTRFYLTRLPDTWDHILWHRVTFLRPQVVVSCVTTDLEHADRKKLVQSGLIPKLWELRDTRFVHTGLQWIRDQVHQRFHSLRQPRKRSSREGENSECLEWRQSKRRQDILLTGALNQWQSTLPHWPWSSIFTTMQSVFYGIGQIDVYRTSEDDAGKITTGYTIRYDWEATFISRQGSTTYSDSSFSGLVCEETDRWSTFP